MQTTLFKVSCCFCQVELQELTVLSLRSNLSLSAGRKNTLGDRMKNQVICIWRIGLLIEHYSSVLGTDEATPQILCLVLGPSV